MPSLLAEATHTGDQGVVSVLAEVVLVVDEDEEEVV